MFQLTNANRAIAFGVFSIVVMGALVLIPLIPSARRYLRIKRM